MTHLLPDLPGAVCASVDPAIFIGDDDDMARTVTAKRICAGCPVLDPCLTWALDHYEIGVWGGTSDRERQQLRRGTRDRASTARDVAMENRRARATDARLYAGRGMTTDQIAERLGVTARAVLRYLNDKDTAA